MTKKACLEIEGGGMGGGGGGEKGEESPTASALNFAECTNRWILGLV